MHKMTPMHFWIIFGGMSLIWQTSSAAPLNSACLAKQTTTHTIDDKAQRRPAAAQDDVRRVKRNLEVPPPEILRFMRRFGYLEPNPSDAESLYHESAIVEALKNIQKYGALKQTGKLDNETLELFTKPRCGVPDIEGTPYYLTTTSSTSKQSSFFNAAIRSKRSFSDAAEVGESDFFERNKRFVIGAPTWKKRRIRYLIANWSLKIPNSQVERDIARAFALWAQYSGLRFERVNSSNADIIVGFGTRYHGDNFPFDGPGNILAHAYYPYEMGSWGGDVHFDEDENWIENSTDLTQGVDFYAVAAHEIGHSLGLAHSPLYSSIMFPYYKGPGAGTILDYDDTLAMYSIYLTKTLEDDIDFATTTIIATTATQEVVQTTATTVDVETQVSVHESGTETTIASTFDDFATVTQQKTVPMTDILSSSSSTTITPSTVWPKPEFSQPPNICHGKFDAVSVLNGTIHIFKNEYVYKLTARYRIVKGYPVTIYELFPFLPADIKRIDAAYERYDGAGVLFTGDSYWTFSYAPGHTQPILIEGSPLALRNLIGTKINTASIDAVMMWPKNNLTYIFAGMQFWRFNDRLRSLDFGYPKSMRRWPGIPSNIDAVATLNNGKTYFFKDNLYWLYDNVRIRPMRGYPRRASTAWLGCTTTTTKKPLRNSNTTVTFIAPLTLGLPWMF